MALQRVGEHTQGRSVEVLEPVPPLDQAVVARLLARPRGRELLALYAEEARSIVMRLREAVVGHDAGETREAAHSLKGSSQYVGANQVAILSAALEQQAREGSLDQADVLLAQLEHEFLRACHAIEVLG